MLCVAHEEDTMKTANGYLEIEHLQGSWATTLTVIEADPVLPGGVRIAKAIVNAEDLRKFARELMAKPGLKDALQRERGGLE